jgi:hypothetical protein
MGNFLSKKDFQLKQITIAARFGSTFLSLDHLNIARESMTQDSSDDSVIFVMLIKILSPALRSGPGALIP